ncbi:MAG: hypothetical protein JWR15_2071 [Prosthecobacter sp.]|nr:hypothetical protein [Prosthecobacter sp.]
MEDVNRSGNAAAAALRVSPEGPIGHANGMPIHTPVSLTVTHGVSTVVQPGSEKMN